MATTMLPPAFGGIVGVPSTKGPQIVRALGPSFDIREANSNNFLIGGATKDSTGTALGNCDVHLFTTLDDLEVQQSVSDASGNYTFCVHRDITHYIVAYKGGAPDLAGTTNNELRGQLGGLGLVVIDDFYSETNADAANGISLSSDTATQNQGAGQSFVSTGGTLVSAKFYLSKGAGSPTGNGVAKLYASTGTQGTDARQTGAALATSDTFDVSTLRDSPLADLITFNFTGVQRYVMSAGIVYCIAFEYSGGDASNKVLMGWDASSPTHSGNCFGNQNGFIYIPNTNDFIFYVYRI